MIYYLGAYLQQFFGPARLLQSYTVLITLALYTGFIASMRLLPRFYARLPHDRGREFTLSAEVSKGKPTGAGIVFISVFIVIAFLCTPLTILQGGTLILTWIMMLTGFLDDKSLASWGDRLFRRQAKEVTGLSAPTLAPILPETGGWKWLNGHYISLL